MHDFLEKHKDKIILIIGAVLICVASFGAGILYTRQSAPKDIKVEETPGIKNLDFEITSFENGTLKGKTDPEATVKIGEDIVKVGDNGKFEMSTENLNASADIIAYTDSEKLTFSLAGLTGLMAGANTETKASDSDTRTNDDEQEDEDGEAVKKETSEKSSEESNSKQGKYVASKNSKKYHTPDCTYAKKIKDENKIWFSSKEEAEAAGYEPCSRCVGKE